MTVNEFLRVFKIDDIWSSCYLVSGNMKELAFLLPQPDTPVKLWDVKWIGGPVEVSSHRYSFFRGIKHETTPFPKVIVQLAREILSISPIGQSSPRIFVARLEDGLILLGDYVGDRIDYVGFLLKWRTQEDEEGG